MSKLALATQWIISCRVPAEVLSLGALAVIWSVKYPPSWLPPFLSEHPLRSDRWDDGRVLGKQPEMATWEYCVNSLAATVLTVCWIERLFLWGGLALAWYRVYRGQA